ncbi:MAG: hypothetical protein Q9159_006198 [Coniocarpon cinnabarinum]
MAELGEKAGGHQTFFQQNKGVIYVLTAQLFGVLMNVTTRLLEIEGNHGEGMHPFQILFVRMTITTTLATAYMWWTKIAHFPFGMPEVRWLLVARGIGGFFGVFGMYYATVITFITPCLSCYVCAKLLKEPFTRMEQVGALISFIGVTFIARPTTVFQRPVHPAPPAEGSTDAAASHPHKVGVADLNDVTTHQRVGAVLIALVGVFGSSMAFVSMRWIGKKAHPLLSVNYFCAWCTVVSAAAMVVLPDVEFILPSGRREWSYLVFLGCCGFAMQFLLSAGLQSEKGNRATLMTYTQMLFALIFDKLVFGHNPTLTSLAGSVMIVTSALYIALQKQAQKVRDEQEKARQQSTAAGSSGVQMSEFHRTRSRSGTMEVRDEERGLMSLDEEEIVVGGKQEGSGHVRSVSMPVR